MNQKLGIAVFALGMTVAAYAAPITIDSGNNPGQNEENVLLTAGTGTTVNGTTNQSNTGVTFVSPNMLVGNAQGQSFITGLNDAALTNITINIASGFTFQDLIFNANVNGSSGLSGGNISISAGGTSQSFTLKNGSNFFTVNSTGAGLTSVGIQSAGFTSLREVRISGVASVDEGGGGGGGEVPEPGSLVLLGTGALLLGGRRLLKFVR